MAPAQRPLTTVAEELLVLLRAHGVEHFFLNPGTDSAPLQEAMRSLHEAGRAIPTVHASTFESVSLAAAHAWFQATGRPACVFVHVDAGTLNLGAMVHDAFRDRAGVIILAGRTPYGEAPESQGGRNGYIQWLQDVPDQAGIVRGYVRAAIEIARAEVVDRVVGRAVQLASGYPAGPVYLTVARDVLMDPPASAEPRVAGYAVARPAALDGSSVEWITDRIVEAESPVLVTSRLGRTEGGFRAVTELAELAGVVVVRGADVGPLSIATDHALHRRSASAVSREIAQADLLVYGECDVPYLPHVTRPGASATVVQLDPDPARASMPLWSYPVDASFTADGPTALSQVVEALRRRAKDSDAIARRLSERVFARSRPEHVPIRALGEPGPMDVVQVFSALNEVLAPEDVIVEEAVTNARGLYETVVRRLPGTFAGAFAPGLGWALGGSIGLKLARPDRRVVAVCGDGSFLFGVPSSALVMAAEMSCPFLTVILDNGGYRASRLPVYELFPEGRSVADRDATGTRFQSAPDFVALATACHAHAERVESSDQLVPALRRALRALEMGRAAVIDAVIEQN